MPKGIQFKVRPRQGESSRRRCTPPPMSLSRTGRVRHQSGCSRPAAHVVPCATELSSLLACFASTADMKAADTCATAAQNLHHCMATTKKVVKPHKPSVRRPICPRVWFRGGIVKVVVSPEVRRMSRGEGKGRADRQGKTNMGSIVRRGAKTIKRCPHMRSPSGGATNELRRGRGRHGRR
jgi:hypothetical protein